MNYDVSKERAVDKNPYYFHVTSTKNIPGVTKSGLASDEAGQIWVFTDLHCSTLTAVYQCGLWNKFALFKIDPQGITGRIVKNKITRYTEKYHRIIFQRQIKPEFVKLSGVFKIDNLRHLCTFIFVRAALRSMYGYSIKDSFPGRGHVLKSLTTTPRDRQPEPKRNDPDSLPVETSGRK